MLGGFHAFEKLDDFAGAEHDRQGLRRFRHRDRGRHRPRLVERDRVEEAQRGHGAADRRRGQVPVVCQIQLVGANLRGAQYRWGLAEVTSEPSDVLHVGALGRRREVANLHVFEHALPKRGHRRLLCARAWPIPGGRTGAYVRIGASNWWANESAGKPGRAS